MRLKTAAATDAPAAPLRRRHRARPPVALITLGVVASLSGAAPALGAGENRIEGSTGPDLLIGTTGPDLIVGGDGNDVIDGRGGNDIIDPGPGEDTVTAGEGNDIVDLRDGERDVVICQPGGEVVIGADPIDRVRGGCNRSEVTIGPGELRRRTTGPIRSNAPLHVVYDFAAVARVLHDGAPGLPGLGSVRTSARQYPLGDPFPADRWLSKVGHSDLERLSAPAMAAFLAARIKQYRIGPRLQADFVAIDEVGVDAQDDGFGPRLHAAMKILARRTHGPTGQPLSRRVLMYAAPKFVANVGEPNDREDWDSAIAAARLSGGVYLQMYHAENGRVTSVATEAEWRDYLPKWSRELASSGSTLRVLFTAGRPSQATQWKWATATAAGRNAVRAGSGAYRLGSASEARAWLQNWNRHAR
ncbi:calcium-binding protein [Miltoncostaea oceani]|uniref:calcium-binding protein n=1 Tax=Miltoncostaea oceani TaxID=2843216 RepID=UPI001C3E072A|nr:calcium-binding protein [Miltoncostaea oceani]